MVLHPTRILLGTALVAGMVACKKDKEQQPVEAAPVYTTVSTLAGTGVAGFADGAGSTAQFSGAEGAAVDAQGNVYVADMSNGRIRKIAPDGTVSTFAGGTTRGLVNGPLATARFHSPTDVALDRQGNFYVTDLGNECIRKITASGTVSTLAGGSGIGYFDGPGATAKFNNPIGVAVDAQGNVYVAEERGHRIRKVQPDGTVSTVAGTGQAGFADGAGSSAQFNRPEGITIDAQGTLYIAEYNGRRIRKITSNGTVSTLAGNGNIGAVDGTGGSAEFYAPSGIIIDVHGDLLVTDDGNSCIRKVTPDGVVTAVTGIRRFGFQDGPVSTAKFRSPIGIAAGAKGVFYVMEGERVRKVTAQ